MSIVEYEIKNQKKQLEFYKELTEQLQNQVGKLAQENIALNKGLSKTRLRRDKYKRKYLKEKRKNKDLQNVIDKAIKFIGNNSPNLSNADLYDLLEILRSKE